MWLETMRKAEGRLRQLLCEDGFAQPDEVEYSPTAITMFWHSVRKAVAVEVNDHGEVGESRMATWRPSGKQGLSCPATGAKATLREKKRAEQDARAMLEDHGVPQPDEVEYGHACIRLLWKEEKFALVIDINGPCDEPAAVAQNGSGTEEAA